MAFKKAVKIDDLLQKIYLDETIFKIEGSQVETQAKTSEVPERLIDCLSSLKNGYVYKVMFKD